VNRESDVVIVGGGFAGGPLATLLARGGIPVTVLERQEQYQDVVRGEFLGTWGVAEATKMGLTDCLQEGGAWSLRWWQQWDEIFHADDAPRASVTATAHPVPGAAGPVTLSHPGSCAAFARAAVAAGARMETGVEKVRLSLDGRFPVVRYKKAGREHALSSRIVVGAGGRYGQTVKQAGIKLHTDFHHWGGGLAIEGLTEWPDDTQAMGTEGEVMFYVLPQGGGRARLYLAYDAQTARRFSGPHKMANFLQAYNLKCVPGSEEIVCARPAGRLASFPSTFSWTDRPLADGVVLVGDEAGRNDSILGTGLACSLWDAHQVAGILLSGHDWSPAAFRGYATERGERMRRLRRAAYIMTRLYAVFDDDARMRRQRANDLMNRNPAHALFMVATLAGPDALPSGPFVDYLADRLLSAA
jgi:2-polyprenyl-6-methoxyphenol hydroxylase-like FAD-dependent oxidoreductase